MGSPRKRRLKRAIAKLGFTAPLTTENKEKLASSVYMTSLLRYVQNGAGESCLSRLFRDGEHVPVNKVNEFISLSGLTGVSTLSDLKLVAPLRVDLSIATGGGNNDPIVSGDKITIGSMVFLFTNAAVGATGVLSGTEIVVQINGVAVNAIGAQFAAALNSPAAATLAAYPELASISAEVQAGGGANPDIVYVESSLSYDLAVSTDADAEDVSIGDTHLRGRQHPGSVPHYFMELDAAGEGHSDIVADSGVLWLQNGPGAKYMHGVDVHANAVTVLIKPPSMSDLEANQKRKMVFRVVSNVASNDVVQVRFASKLQTVASANDGDAGDMHNAPAIYDDIGSIASLAARRLLDDQGDIPLATFCLPADADAEGDGDDGIGGLLVTFDRGTDKSDDEAAASGAGFCLHWRTIGKDNA